MPAEEAVGPTDGVDEEPEARMPPGASDPVVVSGFPRLQSPCRPAVQRVKDTAFVLP